MTDKLSVEILGHVFLFCLPLEPSFRAADAPLLLTHVCRAWRSLAIGKPKLWSRIVVPRWKGSAARGDVIKLMELWLGRAANSLLDIDIQLLGLHSTMHYGSEVWPGTGTFKRVLEVLAPHRSKVCRFEGIIPYRFVQSVGVHDMLNIEELSFLTRPADLLDVGSNNHLHVGPGRDSLRRLTLGGRLNVNTRALLEHTNLTYIQFAGHKFDELSAFELLTGLPALEDVVLDVHHSRGSRPLLFTGRVVLHSLKKLILSSSPNLMILDTIRTPYLQTLYLRPFQFPSIITDSDSDLNSATLYRFFEASHMQLQRLSFQRFPVVTMTDSLSCLACCPSLDSIILDNIDISDDFFHALCGTAESQESHLLPNLQIFSITGCNGFSSKALLQFLRSRASTVRTGFARLRVVVIKDRIQLDWSEIEACGIETLVVDR